MHWPNFALEGPARWITGGGVLIGIAGLVLSETLLSPKYELLYSADIGFAFCTDKDNRRACTFSYNFTLGNTGKLGQDDLRIEWPLDLSRWGVETNVSDIVGSARDTPQPQILGVSEQGKTVYTINGLMPNTMVRFYARCLACTPEQLQTMRQTQPSIVSQGSVHEGDPRLSALRRGAVNVLRLFGLFY
jgi:hypothetical protein